MAPRMRANAVTVSPRDRREGGMFRRILTLSGLERSFCAAVTLTVVACTASFGGVPKLLILEHFADYFG